jgi:membrane protein implicated in regulation of membrane protease activity
MFHKRKRKTDTDQHEKIGIKKIWLRSRILNKLGFILVCIYAVIAGYMFLWMFGGAENILKDRDMLRIGFSLISFAIAALIALYHLATWVFRQKRATDHGIEVDEHGILINTSKNQ